MLSPSTKYPAATTGPPMSTSPLRTDTDGHGSWRGGSGQSQLLSSLLSARSFAAAAFLPPGRTPATGGKQKQAAGTERQGRRQAARAACVRGYPGGGAPGHADLGVLGVPQEIIPLLPVDELDAAGGQRPGGHGTDGVRSEGP